MRLPVHIQRRPLSAVITRCALRTLLAAMFSVGLLGCRVVPQNQPSPTASPSPVPGTDPFSRRPESRLQRGAAVKVARVGVVLSQTGSGAVFGISQRNAITMATEEINQAGVLGEVRLRTTILDDASDKSQAVTHFDRLINQDHVLAILGPTYSMTALAADPLAQQAGIPVLGISNTAGGVTEIGEFVFRDSLTDAQVIPQTVKAVKALLGPQRAAILYQQDDVATRTSGKAFKKACLQMGIPVVAEQAFAREERSFAGYLRAAETARADVVFVSVLGDQAVAIVSQIRQSGLRGVPVVGGNAFNSSTVLRNAGEAAEGVIVGAGWSPASFVPKSQEFVTRYQQRFGSPPDQFAAQAYAGMYILAEAFRTSGTTTDSHAFRDALAGVKNLDTVLGPFSFTPERNADHPAVVQVVRDGKLVPLSP